MLIEEIPSSFGSTFRSDVVVCHRYAFETDRAGGDFVMKSLTVVGKYLKDAEPNTVLAVELPDFIDMAILVEAPREGWWALKFIFRPASRLLMGYDLNALSLLVAECVTAKLA